MRSQQRPVQTRSVRRPLCRYHGSQTRMAVDLIGNGVLALLQHRDQLSAVSSDEERSAVMVDELLRFDSPVQRVDRTALTGVEVPEGGVIDAGELVTVLIGAANRDPLQFAAADRLDIRRRRANTHLTFGAGDHRCLGAPLAHLQARVIIPELMGRLPNLRLAEEPPVWRPTFDTRGLQRLSVVV